MERYDYNVNIVLKEYLQRYWEVDNFKIKFYKLKIIFSRL